MFNKIALRLGLVLSTILFLFFSVSFWSTAKAAKPDAFVDINRAHSIYMYCPAITSDDSFSSTVYLKRNSGSNTKFKFTLSNDILVLSNNKEDFKDYINRGVLSWQYSINGSSGWTDLNLVNYAPSTYSLSSVLDSTETNYTFSFSGNDATSAHLNLIDLSTLDVELNGDSVSVTKDNVNKAFTISRSKFAAGGNYVSVDVDDVFGNELTVYSAGVNVIPKFVMSNLPRTTCPGPDFKMSFTSDVVIYNDVEVYFTDVNYTGHDFGMFESEAVNFSRDDETSKTFTIDGLGEQEYENLRYSMRIEFDLHNEYGVSTTYSYSIMQDRSIVLNDGHITGDPLIIRLANSEIADSISISNGSEGKGSLNYALLGEPVVFNISFAGNYAETIKELKIQADNCDEYHYEYDPDYQDAGPAKWHYDEENDKSHLEYSCTPSQIDSLKDLEYTIIVKLQGENAPTYVINRYTGIANTFKLVPKLNASISDYNAGKAVLNDSDYVNLNLSGMYNGAEVKLKGFITNDGLHSIDNTSWTYGYMSVKVGDIASSLKHDAYIVSTLRVVDRYGQEADVTLNTESKGYIYYSKLTAGKINVTGVWINTTQLKADELGYCKLGDIITVECEADRNMKDPESTSDLTIFNAGSDQKKVKFSFKIDDQYTLENVSVYMSDISVSADQYSQRITKSFSKADLGLSFLPPIQASSAPIITGLKGDYLTKDSIIGFCLDADHEVYLDNATLMYKSDKDRDFNLYPLEVDTIETGTRIYCKIKLSELGDDILNNDNLKFKFSAVLKDNANNSEHYPIDIDNLYCKPLSDSISHIKWSSDNGSFVKQGSVVTVQFESSHALPDGEFKITGKLGDYTLNFVDKGEGKKWAASFTIPADFKLKDNSEIKFKGCIEQIVNGETIDSFEFNNENVENSITYYAPISVTNVVFKSDDKGNEKGYVRNANTVTLSFETTHEIQFVKNEIGGQKVKFTPDDSEDGTFRYTATANVGNLNLEDNVAFDFDVELKDKAGNKHLELTADSTKTSSLNYHAPLDAKDIRLDISIVDRTGIDYAIDKDVVNVKFKTTHPVEITDATIGGKKIEFKNVGGMDWTGTYTVKNGVFKDTEKLPVIVKIKDNGGNKPLTLKVDKIEYNAPIKPTDLKFTSSNGSKTGHYANNTDTLTLSFTSTHDLIPSEIRIADMSIESFDKTVADGIYTFSKTVPVNKLHINDNSDISYFFKLDDNAGNVQYVVTNSNTDAIRYYAPIDPTGITVSTDNSMDTAKYAINGNTITVSFNTSHPVSISSAKIGNYDLSLSATDGMSWIGTFKVPDSIVADTTNIPIRIVLQDAASNTEFPINRNELQYFRPLSVSSAVIHTDNAKDQTKYVADGNRVTIDIVTNHQIDMSASHFNLLGQRFDPVSETQIENGYRYSYSKIMQHGEIADLAQVPFSFDVTDVARSATVARDQNSEEVTNRITYYMPLTVTSSISSNNQYPAFAKNGSSITVTTTLNHAANATGAILNDRSMTISGNNSTGITFGYQIAEDEQNLAEGDLSVAVAYEDVAGNTLTMTTVNEGKVTYDRTRPVIDVANAFSGFTANDVVFDIAITDAHIDTGLTKVSVNNEARTIGNGIDANGNRYTTSVKNDKEGTYTIRIEAADLAGNVADPIVYTITVDKTNPELTKTNVLSDKNRVFDKGVKISDLIDIKDNNSVDVMCTISDSTDFVEWDIDEPIMTDGKKHVTITAQDKAGNPANSLEFDIYIDGTCPEPVIKNAADGKLLEDGMKFSEKVTMDFSLRDLSYDPTKPDFFTVLQIIKPDGTTVDLLESGNSESYSYEFSDPGKYTIVIKANDSIGNETEEIRYTLTIEEQFIDAIKDFFTGSDNNEAAAETGNDSDEPATQSKAKLIAIGGGAGLGVIILVVGAVLVIKKSRRGIR